MSLDWTTVTTDKLAGSEKSPVFWLWKSGNPRCDGIFNDSFIADLLKSVSVKEFWSYDKNLVGVICFDSRCNYNIIDVRHVPVLYFTSPEEGTGPMKTWRNDAKEDIKILGLYWENGRKEGREEDRKR